MGDYKGPLGHTMGQNLGTNATTMTLLGDTYLLPPDCKFLLSDISGVEYLVKGEGFLRASKSYTNCGVYMCFHM